MLALDSLRIDGVRTTIPLQRRLLADEGFRAGDYDVDHLASGIPTGRTGGG